MKRSIFVTYRDPTKISDRDKLEFKFWKEWQIVPLSERFPSGLDIVLEHHVFDDHSVWYTRGHDSSYTPVISSGKARS